MRCLTSLVWALVLLCSSPDSSCSVVTLHLVFAVQLEIAAPQLFTEPVGVAVQLSGVLQLCFELEGVELIVQLPDLVNLGPGVGVELFKLLMLCGNPAAGVCCSARDCCPSGSVLNLQVWLYSSPVSSRSVLSLKVLSLLVSSLTLFTLILDSPVRCSPSSFIFHFPSVQP